jgi:hypothetical protein
MFFLAGFQKCATTWLHKCFEEHPGIFVPTLHMIHYFDTHYHCGEGWYERFFNSCKQWQVRGDTTVSYARSEQAMRRIAQTNVDAKIILSLRNPIERAFSHYWHEKKKEKIQFDFNECLNNYDLYTDWVETGLYSHHIAKLKSLFSPEQIKIVIVDDIVANPLHTIRDIYSFLEVDETFIPSLIQKKVNVAWAKPTTTARILDNLTQASSRILNKRLFPKLSQSIRKEIGKNNTNEYSRGIEREMKEELKIIFHEEIIHISQLLNRNLDHWLE